MAYLILNSKNPSYNILHFVEACSSEPPNVTFSHDAEQSAKKNFNIRSGKELIAFIGNGGLDNRRFKNTEPLRLDLAGNQGKMVDAYHFRDGKKYGYIAFIYNEQKNNWHIKSFKDDTKILNSKIKKLLGER